MKILNLNQIPLRKAIPINKDKKIDLLLKFLDKQTFIPRLTLIYTNEIIVIKIFILRNIDFYLNKNLRININLNCFSVTGK